VLFVSPRIPFPGEKVREMGKEFPGEKVLETGQKPTGLNHPLLAFSTARGLTDHRNPPQTWKDHMS